LPRDAQKAGNKESIRRFILALRVQGKMVTSLFILQILIATIKARENAYVNLHNSISIKPMWKEKSGK
jgi:hypothetical protein